MGLKILPPGTPIPEGAIQIHLGSPQRVLFGRGPCQKESLSLDIYERLVLTYEHWTDQRYGDNPDEDELYEQIVANAKLELERALAKFEEEVHG